MRRRVKEKTGKIILLLITVTSLLMIGNAAVRAAQNPSGKSAKEIVHRRVKFNDKFFDLYVNQKEKFITVHGQANDWEELKEIEKHFNVVAPKDYEIAYDIDFYCNRRL